VIQQKNKAVTIGGSRGSQAARTPSLFAKKSLKLTVKFLKLEQIFEIYREFAM
jgi:hypothetical protein